MIATKEITGATKIGYTIQTDASIKSPAKEVRFKKKLEQAKKGPAFKMKSKKA